MLAGTIVVSVPHVVTLLVGHHILKLHPGILIGVCCGAGTSAPALAAVEEEAMSKIPALGYGAGCALGNIVLSLWGSVIVLLMAHSAPCADSRQSKLLNRFERDDPDGRGDRATRSAGSPPR